MDALHLPTAYFIAGMLYCVLPIAVWLQLRKVGSLSVGIWSGGGFLFGVGLILLARREHLPAFTAYTLANFFLFFGTVLRSHALRLELHRPSHWAWPTLTSVLFALVVQALHAWANEPHIRFIWSSVGLSAALIWVALLSKELHQRDSSMSAQWIYGVYLTLSILIGLRAISVALGATEPNALFTDGLSMAMVVLGVFTSIVGNMGFLGMYIERLNQANVQTAQARARQEEAALLNDQIAQLDRRRSVGEIAASLAHELSQPLTNIYLIADRMGLELQQKKDTSLIQFFADLDRNVQKVGDILGRIRGFIRAKDTQFERIELHQVINEVGALISDLTHNESIDLKISLPTQNIAVMGDLVQLSQIFMNVLRNGIQATQGQAQRQLAVEVRRQASTALITFTDNGPGFPAEFKNQVGAAFFTTKKDGLGVGLSIAKSIAVHHGGDLNFRNSLSGGAVIELNLPAMN